jgi:hypothetical protein
MARKGQKCRWNGSDKQKQEIITVIDAMMSLDCNWPLIEMELIRRCRLPNSSIEEIPSTKTLEKWVLSYNDSKTWSEYSEKRKDYIKYQLRQNAINMSLKDKNVPMSIFCLKNICGWSDNPSFGEDDNRFNINVVYNYDDDKK